MPIYELGLRARCGLDSCGVEQVAGNEHGLIALNWQVGLTKGAGKKPIKEAWCSLEHQVEDLGSRLTQLDMFESNKIQAVDEDEEDERVAVSATA